MDLGRMLNGAIAPFAPRWAVRREAARIAYGQIRGYDAAARNRRTKGWKRPSTSQNAENARALRILSASAADLFRNNKYAAGGLRHYVGAVWGDGIAPMIAHTDKAVQQTAQDEWDRWAESMVGDQVDWYGHGKLLVRGAVGPGESLTLWQPGEDGLPDGAVVGLEGEYLDESRTEHRDGGRIVQGVEFRDRRRAAYWLFDEHPGDVIFSRSMASRRIEARYIDHCFEKLSHTQARGISRFSPLMMTLRDIADIEDSRRLQEKVAACVGMVLQSQPGGEASPLVNNPEVQSDNRPDVETVTPGMILRPPPGVTAHSFTPAPSADGTNFIRQQLAAVSASLVPYHVLTGDVSQANYSGLRAALLSQWTLLDDDQQNMIIPLICKPALERRMRVLAARTGDSRFLEVKATWALPVRRHADPVKDLMAELIEIRSGLKLVARSLAERGINAEEHMREIKRMNDLIDSLGLALESDPRRVTKSGVLQAAAGYLMPKNGMTDSATAD